MCSDINFFLIVSGFMLGHFIYDCILLVINKTLTALTEAMKERE